VSPSTPAIREVSREQSSEGRQQRTENRMQREESREQRPETREQKTGNRKQRAEGREQRANMREQRACVCLVSESLCVPLYTRDEIIKVDFPTPTEFIRIGQCGMLLNAHRIHQIQ
jgi:Ulp1 family protease